jgi:hypothetical protein
MPDFASLLDKFQVRAIRNCPGRYILAGAVSRIPPGDLIRDATVREYQVKTAPDPVVVVTFDGGGIISYRKADGSYLHTLNTSEGFKRKLEQLGISLTE